jgi:RHS repeat-associated protein
MGRITSVTEKPSGGASATVVSSVAYEPFGPDAGFRSGNAGQETRSFDQGYRLTNITDLGTVRRGVTRVLENLSYAYYPTNNVETITDAVTSGNSQSFSYDNLQRLSAATGEYGSFGFTYDNDGNRLSQTFGGVTTNYGYGTGNDLLQTISMGGITTQTIGYTADGRMASFTPGIESPGSQYITSLSYNQDAQLAAVNSSNGALANYTYDGFGQRLLKTISSTYGEIYQYGQDGMLLEETNASGVAQADYIYLNGRPIADLAPSTGTLYSLQDDMLGTPQLATDSSQNTQWQASYEPFGTTSSVSGSITQNLRLPGQYFDSESGWNHNGFRNYLPDLGRYAEPDPLALQGTSRFYDPATGQSLSVDLMRFISGSARYHSRSGERFINDDPITFMGRSPNAYAYVMNNPADYRDPLGLWQITITVGWGYVVRFTIGNNGGTSNLAGLVNGQWNVGLYGGVGEGLSIDADLFDRGCHSHGSNWGVEGAGDIGFGPHLEGEAHVGSESWGNLNFGFPGTPLGWSLGNEGVTVPTVGVGESAFYGIGGTHYF